jgi:hypothetical protein
LQLAAVAVVDTVLILTPFRPRASSPSSYPSALRRPAPTPAHNAWFLRKSQIPCLTGETSCRPSHHRATDTAHMLLPVHPIGRAMNDSESRAQSRTCDCGLGRSWPSWERRINLVREGTGKVQITVGTAVTKLYDAATQRRGDEATGRRWDAVTQGRCDA